MGVSRLIASRVKVETWLGISLDEIQRMRDSREKWNTHVYPLIDLRWRRNDCVRYMADNHPDVVVGKSSCLICPFHSRRQWVSLYREYPDEIREGAELEARMNRAREINGKTLRLGDVYMHVNRKPLLQAIQQDIDMMERNPELPGFESEGWGNECSGHCGV